MIEGSERRVRAVFKILGPATPGPVPVDDDRFEGPCLVPAGKWTPACAACAGYIVDLEVLS
jgi:hypothetical protein